MQGRDRNGHSALRTLPWGCVPIAATCAVSYFGRWTEKAAGGRWSSAKVSLSGVALGGVLAMYLPSATGTGSGEATTVVGAFVLILFLLVAPTVVPSTVMGRARESFRRRVRTDPALRKALEEDPAAWPGPYGNAAYGPL